jgi:hypothetical protein
VRIILRNPRKEIEVDGKRRVKELLVEHRPGHSR